MGKNYQSLFDAGVKAQRERMNIGRGYKSGWDEVNEFYALSRLMDNAHKLERDCRYPIPGKDEKTRWEEMREHAADISNYAHMIILACDKEIEKL